MVLMNEHDNLRTCARKAATKALARVQEGKHLEQSLEKALHYVKGLEEEMSSLKDEIMVTSSHYFEMAKEHVAFFFLNLNFRQMNLFQVVRDG